MSQIKQVISTLKRTLKEKNYTYARLAEGLEMSEANVKRMFSQHSFSLDRLEAICSLLEISISDLFLLAEKDIPKLTQLTLEQENELMQDTKLFLVAVCVRDGWTFEDIIEQYNINAHECTRLLVRLDKLKLIELLPNNHYKLLIAQDFRWIPDGPLEKFMEKDVISRFMQSRFEEDSCFRFYLRGSYCESSIELIQQKLNVLTKEVAELNQTDSKLPLAKRQHIGLLFAMRPWELQHFKRLRRQ